MKPKKKKRYKEYYLGKQNRSKINSYRNFTTGWTGDSFIGSKYFSSKKTSSWLDNKYLSKM
jgi:hypothetical protein